MSDLLNKMKPLPCAVCGKPNTNDHVCTLKCPTCGHDVKYGYIEPVKRNDVLDEVIVAIENKSLPMWINDGLIESIEELKD